MFVCVLFQFNMVWNWAQNLPGHIIYGETRGAGSLSFRTHMVHAVHTERTWVVLPGRDPSVLHWISQMEVDISCQGVDETCCAVCRDIFVTSVVLCCIGCDFSFCNSCLEKLWIKHGTKECPLCFKASLGLPRKSCGAHGERLFLICAVDLEPVCSICHRSGLHMNHRVYPITEAFKDCKVSWIKIHSILSKMLKYQKSVSPNMDTGDTLHVSVGYACRLLKHEEWSLEKTMIIPRQMLEIAN